MRTLSGMELLWKLLDAAKSTEGSVSLHYSTKYENFVACNITDIAGVQHTKTFSRVADALEFAKSLGEVKCEYEHVIFERELGGEA